MRTHRRLAPCAAPRCTRHHVMHPFREWRSGGCSNGLPRRMPSVTRVLSAPCFGQLGRQSKTTALLAEWQEAGSRRGCPERRLPLADPWLVGWSCVRACARACVFCVCCVSCVFSLCFLCALSVVCACVVCCVLCFLCVFLCVGVVCVVFCRALCVSCVLWCVVVLVVLAAIIRVRAVENDLPSVVEPGNGEKLTS